jgi:LmbE family N-acetylglucosaminyl deacetylase
MTHLFLSPHFDDAVLSCGGTIHHLIAAGEPVEVRTVFAGTPHQIPDTPFIHELHLRWQEGAHPVQMRTQEDDEALRRIGAVASRMVTWPDCVYRIARNGLILYPDRDSIFGEIHPADFAGQFLPTIVFPAHDLPRVIYAPLGAGHHVDHQIVRNWAVNLKEYYPWVALKFYEEYPYSEDAQAVDNALSFFQQVCPALQLKQETMTLTEADIQAKLTSIACYRSQISSFWNDNAHMESATRQSLLAVGQGIPAERYWVVS